MKVYNFNFFKENLSSFCLKTTENSTKHLKRVLKEEAESENFINFPALN